jgi:hypothetical protein
MNRQAPEQNGGGNPCKILTVSTHLGDRLGHGQDDFAPGVGLRELAKW